MKTGDPFDVQEALDAQSLARLVGDIAALKQACAKSHRSSIGGSAMCICGACNGGSEACNGLRSLKCLLDAVGAIRNDMQIELETWKEML